MVQWFLWSSCWGCDASELQQPVLDWALDGHGMVRRGADAPEGTGWCEEKQWITITQKSGSSWARMVRRGYWDSLSVCLFVGLVGGFGDWIHANTCRDKNHHISSHLVAFVSPLPIF